VVTLGLDGQGVGTTPGDAGSQHYPSQVADNVVNGGHGQQGPGLVDSGADGGTTVVVPGSGDEYVGGTSGATQSLSWVSWCGRLQGPGRISGASCWTTWAMRRC